MNLEIGIAGWVLSGEILREKTLTLLEFPSVCASYGVKTVELCSAFFESQDARYLNTLRKALQDNELAVRNIAVDMGNIAGADAAVRRTDIEALKQWFYTGAALGSQAIRINTGSADDAGAMQRVIEGYNELLKVAEQSGIKLLMENHGGISATANSLNQILGRIDSPWFGTCPDTANFAPNDWEAGMRALAPRAFSCHVKVFSYSKDGDQSWADRNGQTRSHNLKTCLEILKEDNYRGPLCIEKGASENVREGIRETIAYVAELQAAI